MPTNHPSGLDLSPIPGDHVLDSPRLSELRLPADGMLVLSRLNGERIVLHDGRGHVVATVTVVEIRGGKIRLGIAADRRITVDRDEVYRDREREAGRG